MRSAREGSFLTISIRLALQSLGREPFDRSVARMTLEQKRAYLKELRQEQIKVGGILKEGVNA
jgi:hypothetical protein